MSEKKQVGNANNYRVIAIVAVLVIAGIAGLEYWRGQNAGPSGPGAQGNEGENALQVNKDGFQRAPELRNLSGYLNTDDSISLASLKGKVVLVDFWTYSCINCIRTLPYLQDWHEKYADKGLVIIGVHAPEFFFEKDIDNVRAAVEEHGIGYPVVLDNDFATWRAYQNRFWPHKFLIDAQGYIRYDHIGEGAYEETEQKIVELLRERDASLELDEQDGMDVKQPEFNRIGTPEIYLGYGFARAPIANPEGLQPGQVVAYTLPESAPKNIAALGGTWQNENDYVELVSDTGKVALTYEAKALNIVAGSESGSALDVALDGAPIASDFEGKDTVDGKAHVDEERLYNLVDAPDYGTHTLVLDVNGAGFRLYTFTFG